MKKDLFLNHKMFSGILLAAVFAFSLFPPSVTGQEENWDDGTEEAVPAGKETNNEDAGNGEKTDKKADKKSDKKSDKGSKKTKKEKKEKKTSIGKSGGKKKKDKKDKKSGNTEKSHRIARDRRHGAAGRRDEYEFAGKQQKVADYVNTMMVKVPAGEFLMGSADDEKERYTDERQHKVKITQDFYIGKYEVTQDFYLAVMGRRAYNPVHRGKDRPMENVTWFQAIEFCREMNKLDIAPEGYFFFLPTEAQWEYAARGGDKGKKSIYAGGDKIDDVAVYEENGSRFTSREDSVGQKKANSLSLFDMSGGVAEWCYDWYAPYPPDKEEGIHVDPRGPKQKKYSRYTLKVTRGGHWGSPAADCRVAARGKNTAGSGFRCGFRLVLIQPPVKYDPKAAAKKAPAKKTPPAKKDAGDPGADE
ncbi:MAG: formylglycine-generating enzyme family protein [Lentisphaeria bacterium]|nr:formylglycine-generating enzyme family protein [Lentisphaeria bacterium]